VSCEAKSCGRGLTQCSHAAGWQTLKMGTEGVTLLMATTEDVASMNMLAQLLERVSVGRQHAECCACE
jgi:hypothetical protein